MPFFIFFVIFYSMLYPILCYILSYSIMGIETDTAAEHVFLYCTMDSSELDDDKFKSSSKLTEEQLDDDNFKSLSRLTVEEELDEGNFESRSKLAREKEEELSFVTSLALIALFSSFFCFLYSL